MYSIVDDRALTFFSSSTHRELPIKNNLQHRYRLMQALSVRQRIVVNQLLSFARTPNLTKRKERTEVKHLSKDSDCQIASEKSLCNDGITLVKVAIFGKQSRNF